MKGRRRARIARRRAWSGRSQFGSGWEWSAWVGSGRPGTSRRWPGWTDRFRVTAVYDQVCRRAEIEAAQIGCAACEGLSALVERPDVDVIYLAVAAVVRAASDRPGLRGGQAGVLRPAAGRRPRRSWRRWSSWSSPAGSSSCPSSPGGAIRRPCGSRSCWRPSWDRPGWSSGTRGSTASTATRCPGPTTQIAPAPLLIDPGSYLLDWCGFVFQSLPESGARVCGAGSSRTEGLAATAESDFESFVGRVRRGATAHISFGLYQRALLGRRQPVPAAARAFRSTPSAAWPAWRCPSGSSGRGRRHPGRAAAAGADGRRRAQRPVPSPGPRGSIAGADDPRRLTIARLRPGRSAAARSKGEPSSGQREYGAHRCGKEPDRWNDR